MNKYEICVFNSVLIILAIITILMVLIIAANDTVLTNYKNHCEKFGGILVETVRGYECKGATKEIVVK